MSREQWASIYYPMPILAQSFYKAQAGISDVVDAGCAGAGGGGCDDAIAGLCVVDGADAGDAVGQCQSQLPGRTLREDEG